MRYLAILLALFLAAAACSFRQRYQRYANQREGYFRGSSIVLTQEEVDYIVNLLPEGRFATVLLYNASADGWSPEDFHRLSDGASQSLVLFTAKETGLRSFGYTSKSWHANSSITVKPDDGAFIASLDLSYSYSSDQGAIITGSNTGPAFGNFNGRKLYGAPSVSTGLCIAGSETGFNIDLDENGNCILSGLPSGPFELSNMEVWQIITS